MAATQGWSAPRKTWAHKPTTLTLAWLFISLPIVFWDAGFILLRPHTFVGGKYHDLLWKPYAIYQRVDLVYSPSAREERNGWPGAQAAFNVIETLGYYLYLWMVTAHTSSELKRGVNCLGSIWTGLLGDRQVEGTRGAAAALLLFALSFLTLTKTLLYGEILLALRLMRCRGGLLTIRFSGLVESYSGFRHVSHNSAMDLFRWYILTKYVLISSSPEPRLNIESVFEVIRG